MRKVRFLQKSSPYRVGEIAGFDDAVAERLVSLGAAEYLNAPMAGGATMQTTDMAAPPVAAVVRRHGKLKPVKEE